MSEFADDPAVARGSVYVGDDNGDLYARNTATGAELWRFTTGESVLSSAAVANGVVYLGADQKVYAFHLPGGAARTARPRLLNRRPDDR